MKITHTLIVVLTALFGFLPTLHAQTENITQGGLVMSESGEELIGVSVVIKDNPGQGTITDMDGHFKMSNLKKGDILVFSYIGYIDQEINVNATNERLRIVMKENLQMIEEVVIVGQGTQRKISVTGAITNVEVGSLQVPASSVSNMLAGRVPGIIAVTRSGEPGNDFSEFWIRGISTFGAGSSALVLIDGVEGNLNDLNPADIESFSILKDASATAVYGMKGANGVVLVTTKRGVAGKLTINVKSNVSLSQSARMPKYVDAHQYAALANEARVVRGQRALYTDAELRLFETGLDPDLYPNINWTDVVLNNHIWNQEHHFSASGGGTNARYYLSLGIQNKEALFKQDNINKYNTNINYNKYNFRANVDIDMTKTTNLVLGLESVIIDQNFPGYGNNSDDLWQAQASMTPVIAPLMYSDGSLPAFGDRNSSITPYVLLNHTGYQKHFRNTNKINLQFKQDLGMITKGLSMSLLFHLNANSVLDSWRTKMPALYYADGRKRDGSLNLKQTVEPWDPYYGRSPFLERTYYYEGRANYERFFAEKHRITGLFNVNLSDYVTSKHVTDLTAIPKRYLAYSGRATYSYKDTYSIEGNLGYTGSEAFEKGKKFGWFPAISVAWVPTQYEWVKNNINLLDFLKFRFSYGIVGNDKLTWDDSVRFPYLTIMESGSTGNYWNSMGSSIVETQVGSNNLRWEKSTKTNFGIDAKFFKERFDLTVDFFKDIRSGIYQQREDIPDEMGLVSMPWANVGKMKSWGVDGNISYTQPFNKDTYLTIRANYTQSNSKVLQYEESVKLYPYQTAVGYRSWVQRGFIAEGLFKDQADIDNSPRQTLGGTVMPGDIKYKDVNGDGIINWDDVVPLKYGDYPGVNYGFAAEFNWKKWNFNIFFEGVANVTYFYGMGNGGYGYYPFRGGQMGNVLEIVADQKNRWTPAWYSGDPATENPNARFPRLSYGDHTNNYVNSTFWMVSGNYLRLKNVQVSYRWESPFMERIGLQSATLSFIGDNLALWDKVGIWDPAQTKESGMKYPIQRIYTLQVQLKF